MTAIKPGTSPVHSPCRARTPEIRDMWTRSALHSLIDARLRGQRLIVVANREPYIHRYVGDVVECMRPASGMATALDPMMLACGGTWVAHGSGDADRLTVDGDDRVRVPPENPRYTLRRGWRAKKQGGGGVTRRAQHGGWAPSPNPFPRPPLPPPPPP